MSWFTQILELTYIPFAWTDVSEFFVCWKKAHPYESPYHYIMKFHLCISCLHYFLKVYLEVSYPWIFFLFYMGGGCSCYFYFFFGFVFWFFFCWSFLVSFFSGSMYFAFSIFKGSFCMCWNCFFYRYAVDRVLCHFGLQMLFFTINYKWIPNNAKILLNWFEGCLQSQYFSPSWTILP